MKYFKMLDIFGKKINFRFQGNDRFQTNCGACATLAMILILVGFLMMEAFSIYRGEVESLNYLNKDIDAKDSFFKKKKFLLKEETIGIGLKNLDLYNGFIKLRFSLYNYETDSTIQMINQVYRCENKVLGNLSGRVQIKNLNNSIKIYCFNTPLSRFKEGYVPMIEILECDTIDCKPKKLREKMLRNFRAYGFVLADETKFNMQKTKWEKKFIATEISASNQFVKEVKFWLKEAEFHEKKGLIIPKTKINYTKFFDKVEEKVLAVSSNRSFLRLKQDFDKYSKVVITKKYKSLLALLAFLGGFSKGLSLILFFLVFPVREILFMKKLINHMFNICLDPDQIDAAVEMMWQDNDEDQVVEDGSPRRTKILGFQNLDGDDQEDQMFGRGLMDEMVRQQEENQKMMMERMKTFTLEAARKSGKLGSIGSFFACTFGKKLDRNVEDSTKRIRNFENGKMKDLGEEELSILRLESVKKGLRRWKKVSLGKFTSVDDFNERNGGRKFTVQPQLPILDVIMEDGNSDGSSVHTLTPSNRRPILVKSTFEKTKSIGEQLKSCELDANMIDDSKSNNLNLSNPGMIGKSNVPSFENNWKFQFNKELPKTDRKPSKFKQIEPIKSPMQTVVFPSIPFPSLGDSEHPKSEEEESQTQKPSSKKKIQILQNSLKPVKQLEQQKIEFDSIEESPVVRRAGATPKNLGFKAKLTSFTQGMMNISTKQIVYKKNNFTTLEDTGSPKKSKKMIKAKNLKSINSLLKKPSEAGGGDTGQKCNTSLHKGFDENGTVLQDEEITSGNRRKRHIKSILKNKNTPAFSSSNRSSKSSRSMSSRSSKSSKSSSFQRFSNEVLKSINSAASAKRLSPMNKNRKRRNGLLGFIGNIGDQINNFTKAITKIGLKEKKNKPRQNRLKSKKTKEIEYIQNKNKQLMEKEDQLKFYTTPFDYFRLILPKWVHNSSKKELFSKGQSMIEDKLDLTTMITALNELEKLKLLLFDKYQYFLFEHIPKPFLIDSMAAKLAEERKNPQSLPGGKEKIKKKDKATGGEVLMSNNSFWAKKLNEQINNENFAKALDHIKSKKEEDFNIIDRRLLDILNSMKIGAG